MSRGNTSESLRSFDRGWKLKRELHSLIARAFFLVFRPIERVAQRSQRLMRSKSIVEGRTNAQWRNASKVAIFVVFQPGKLLDSVLCTVEHLAKNGFAVVIVANGGLSTEGRVRLSKEAWTILERPNFGRDFAAYKAGLAYIWEKLHQPIEILLINDSVIFPITTDSTVLQRVTTKNADVVALFATSRDLRKAPRQKYGMLSYFIWHSAKISRDKRLHDFWKHYIPSNFKHYTLKFGERAYSSFLVDQGFSCASLCNPEAAVEFVGDLPLSALEKILEYASFQDLDIVTEYEHLLKIEDLSERRRAMVNLIGRATKRRWIVSTFPYLVIELLKIDCVKRGSTPLQKQTRKIVGAMGVESALSSIDPRVRLELCNEGSA